MPIIRINDELQLRELSSDDAKVLFHIVDKNRAYLREWLPWLDKYTSEADSLKFILDSAEKWKEKKALVLAIQKCKDIVGIISFNTIDLAEGLAKIGYWIASHYQGQGIVFNASLALINYGFNELALKQITINCAEHNTKSQSIPKKLGFKLTRKEIAKEWLYDHHVSHDVYSMTKEIWGSLHTGKPLVF